MVSANKIVSDLVELCYSHGIRDVVLSPGSRNAPFSITFQEDQRFTCYVIPDERAAAFFALGLSQYTGKITAICCTSGTAAVNYGPALAEAYYQRIPILAITADRPDEWIDQGIGQSVHQKGLFDNFIIKSHHLPSDPNQHHYAARLVNEVLLYANNEIKGPVHLNVPLYEPLYETVETRESLPKVVTKAKLFSKVAPEAISELAKEWNQSKRKLIVVGALEKSKRLQENINKIAADPSVVVLTETHSNLYNPIFHPSIDRLIEGLQQEDQVEYAPDILVTFGQNLISKRLKYMLFKMNIRHHWHIDASQDLVDTYRSLTMQIDDHPSGFFDLFAPQVKPASEADYKEQWQKLESRTLAIHNEFSKQVSYSDYFVYKEVLKSIPEGSYIQMGNSASVRYVQLFPQRDDITYHGNRGVSGIDGCTSTTVGAAWHNSKALTVLLSGDISFLYDVNGLWHSYVSPNVRIVIINNRGGGIFRIIKGPSTTNHLESTFEARHHFEAEYVAKTYGLEYTKAENKEELRSVIPDFFDRDKKTAAILEIFTPPEVNDKVLMEYFEALKK